ncbi:MAG: helix-turn-helix transcriptional regulator [Saprospiraceae bacterium]
MLTRCPSDLVKKTRQIIQKSLHHPNLSLTDLCQAVGYSYSHLHQIIKVETGMTLAHLVRDERLRVAEQLLVESDENISEICFAVGFKDPNYFTRVFRIKHGVAPRAWRFQKKEVK